MGPGSMRGWLGRETIPSNYKGELFIMRRGGFSSGERSSGAAEEALGGGALDTTKRVLFSHASAEHHVDHWIADGGTNFRAAVREAFASNMEDMIKLMVHYTF